MITEGKTIEQRLLIQSAVLTALVAISGTIMGVAANSNAILLDGITAFIGVVIKLMMLITSHLVMRETSKRFQFGYWQFEPLVLIVEGSFSMLIIFYGFFSGVSDLLGGGHSMKFGMAVFYAFIFTIADTAYYLYVRNINKRLNSNLLHFDNISWSIDAALEAGILLSFLIGWSIEQTEWARFSVYVDPIVLIVLSLQMLPAALKILIPSLKQIMGWAPMALHNRIQYIMDDFMARYGFIDYVSSIQGYGNVKIIEIDILVPKDYKYQTIVELDRIRNEIDETIGGKPSEKWVTISFTATKRWMAKDYLLDEEEPS